MDWSTFLAVIAALYAFNSIIFSIWTFQLLKADLNWKKELLPGNVFFCLISFILVFATSPKLLAIWMADVVDNTTRESDTD